MRLGRDRRERERRGEDCTFHIYLTNVLGMILLSLRYDSDACLEIAHVLAILFAEVAEILLLHEILFGIEFVLIHLPAKAVEGFLELANQQIISP